MFHFAQKILFKHCDPAGIVFYPRYFEMINDVIEAFFDDALHAPFPSLLMNAGVPTAEITARFHAPSRHGDVLTFDLGIARMGRASMGLRVVARAGDELRLTGNSTLVHVDKTGRPIPWPDDIRSRIAPYEVDIP